MKLNDLKNWIEKILTNDNLIDMCELFVGDYVETSHDRDKILISIKLSGGVMRPPFIRYQNARLVVLSPNKRMNDYEDDAPSIGGNPPPNTIITSNIPTWQDVENVVESLVLASNSDIIPECCSGFKLQGLPSGMLYTTEGNIYFTLDFQALI